MTPKECAACKVAEADAKIAELEQAIAAERAASQVEVRNLDVQLRYQRRINGVLQAMPVDPLGDAMAALMRGK